MFLQREGVRAVAQLFYLTAPLPNPLPKGEREPFETLSLKSEKNLKTLPARMRGKIETLSLKNEKK